MNCDKCGKKTYKPKRVVDIVSYTSENISVRYALKKRFCKECNKEYEETSLSN